MGGQTQLAKLYTKIAQARGRVTYFANNARGLPVPELVEIVATEAHVVDEADRVTDAKRKKAVAVAKHKEREARWELECAQRQLAEAQAKIERLTRT